MSLPPLYFRELSDFKNTNIEFVQKSINSFDWARAFQNQNYNKQCQALSEALLNTICNFVPHKIKKFDYKTPEWINKLIILSLKK